MVNRSLDRSFSQCEQEFGQEFFHGGQEFRHEFFIMGRSFYGFAYMA